MTREDVLQAVRILYAGPTTEDEDVALVTKLSNMLPNSSISDLIFWDFRGLTPEQVVEEAYRREAEHAASR